MPLRDHFHPPISKRSSWEGFHGGWPMYIIEELAPRLPEGFVAEPRVHLGSYAYEVLIFDLQRERRLVAAVEIASPANKDRPESRRLFAAKCFNLLRQDVSVSIVDLVTIRQFNLYEELLALLGQSDPAPDQLASTYAVTCRKRPGLWRAKVDSWFRPLAIGERLPCLPVWLSETEHVSLDLEASYEETCRVLRIR
jgi:hypothetical protein